MMEVLINGSPSQEKLHMAEMTGRSLESYKKLLPDCVLDTEPGKKRLSEILCEGGSFCGATTDSSSLAANAGSASFDNESQLPTSNPSDDEPYVVMNPPSSSTSSATSPHCQSTTSSTPSEIKLPPGVTQESLRKLFPLNSFSDESSSLAGVRDEEDRPLAGLCAALLGRAVQDGLSRAYVRGVLAVARTVARAFFPAALAWRDPKSGLDLLDLALRHGHASTLLQLSNFSEEFRERLRDKEKELQLSPGELLPGVLDGSPKLSDDGDSAKCDHGNPEFCANASSVKKELTKDNPEAVKHNGPEKIKKSGRSLEKQGGVTRQRYDSMAQHLISVEHQRCDISRNECPLFRPSSARSFRNGNISETKDASPRLTNNPDASLNDSNSSQSPHKSAQDKPVAGEESSPQHFRERPEVRSLHIQSSNRGMSSEAGAKVPICENHCEALYDKTQSSQAGVIQANGDNDDENACLLGVIESPSQELGGPIFSASQDGSPLIDTDRNISGSSNPEACQEEHELQQPNGTPSSIFLDPVRQLHRPKGILKRGRKKYVGPTRSVTFSADTKRGSTEYLEYEYAPYSNYVLRRCPAKMSLNFSHESYDVRDTAHLYVNTKFPVTRPEGEISFAESSLSDSLEQVGSEENAESRNDVSVRHADSLPSLGTAPQSSSDRATSSPRKPSANGHLECNCMGCYWLKSMKTAAASTSKKTSSKPSCAALKVFEVKSSSMSKLTSLSAFLTRNAGKAKRFVRKARTAKPTRRRCVSASASTVSSDKKFDVGLFQDKTLDRAFVDQRDDCTFHSNSRQEGRVDSKADAATSLPTRDQRFPPGQTGWRCADGCYANGITNPAFCDSSTATDDIQPEKPAQRGNSGSQSSYLPRQATKDRGRIKTATQAGASPHLYESLDDTLMAVDELIRDSVHQISLMNVSETAPSHFDPSTNVSSLRREVPGMDSLLQGTASRSRPNEQATGNVKIQRICTLSPLQGADSTYYTSMHTVVGLAAGEGDQCGCDNLPLSIKSRPAPTGLTVDSPFHVACYFGSSGAVAHLASTRDLDLDLDLPGAVTLAGHAPDGGEGVFKHGVPTSRTHTVVGTPLNLCELGGHPELASLRRELRAAA